MRTNIDIDDVLMREAQKASGHATKKQTVEEALRLMIRLRRQHEVDAAFGRHRWRGNLRCTAHDALNYRIKIGFLGLFRTL